MSYVVMVNCRQSAGYKMLYKAVKAYNKILETSASESTPALYSDDGRVCVCGERADYQELKSKIK